MDTAFFEDYREVSRGSQPNVGDMAVWPPAADPEEPSSWLLFDAEEWRGSGRAPGRWSGGDLG